MVVVEQSAQTGTLDYPTLTASRLLVFGTRKRNQIIQALVISF